MTPQHALWSALTSRGEGERRVGVWTDENVGRRQGDASYAVKYISAFALAATQQTVVVESEVRNPDVDA